MSAQKARGGCLYIDYNEHFLTSGFREGFSLSALKPTAELCRQFTGFLGKARLTLQLPLTCLKLYRPLAEQSNKEDFEERQKAQSRASTGTQPQQLHCLCNFQNNLAVSSPKGQLTTQRRDARGHKFSPGLYFFALTMPVSTTYFIPVMVMEVSAMLVEMITLR